MQKHYTIKEKQQILKRECERTVKEIHQREKNSVMGDMKKKVQDKEWEVDTNGVPSENDNGKGLCEICLSAGQRETDSRQGYPYKYVIHVHREQGRQEYDRFIPRKKEYVHVIRFMRGLDWGLSDHQGCQH